MIDCADIRHRRSIRSRGYDYARNGAYFVTLCTQSRACLFGDIVDGGMRLNDAGRMVEDTWDALPAHYPGIGIDACVVMPNHLHGIIVIDHVGATPRGRPATAGGHADLGRAADMGHAVVPGQARWPAPARGVGVVGHDPDSGRVAGPGQARGPALTGGVGAVGHDPDSGRVAGPGQARGPAPTGGVGVVGHDPDSGRVADPGQARGPAPTDGVVGHDPDSGRVADPGQARGPAPAGGVCGAGGVRLSLPDVVHRLKTLTTRRYIDGVRQSGWPGFVGRLWQRNYYEHIIRDEDALGRIREYIVNNPVQWALDRENPVHAERRRGESS